MDRELIYNVAKCFHVRYELNAKKEGWETQKSCKVDFEDLPNENKETMLKTAEEVLNLLLLVELGEVKEVVSEYIKDDSKWEELEDKLNAFL